MMRRFQIWPQNPNRPKNGSNFILFEFWCQIWNPLVILHILGTHLIWFALFLPPMHFQKFEIKFVTPRSDWNRFVRAPLNSACLKPCETTRHAFNFQSWCFLNNPTGHPPTVQPWWNITVWPRTYPRGGGRTGCAPPPWRLWGPRGPQDHGAPWS